MRVEAVTHLGVEVGGDDNGSQELGESERLLVGRPGAAEAGDLGPEL